MQMYLDPIYRRPVTLACAALLLLTAGSATAQQAAPTGRGNFELTIDNIMRGPELVGRPPAEVRWTPDSRWIYFQWAEPGADWRAPLAPFRVRAAPGARPERVGVAHFDSVAPRLVGGSRPTGHRYEAVAHRGDLYLLDRRSGTSRRLTATLAVERDPRVDREGRRVLFLRENNAFSLDVATGLLTQLTDIRSGSPRRDETRRGQRATLEAQQRELFEAVRDQLRADSIARAEAATRDFRPDSLFLRDAERVTALAASPSGSVLLLSTSTSDTTPRATDVPQYVTGSGYTERLQVRSKVGDVQQEERIALVRLPSGRAQWLTLLPTDSAEPPAAVTVLGWNEDGSRALLSAVTRDFTRRYLHSLDAATGRLSTVELLTDTAWVAGPCFGCAGWYAGGERVWYVSEADGYAHLYTSTPDGRDRRQLTRGRWEVQQVELSADGRHFYLHGTARSPYERHLYRLPVEGGELVQITQRPGGHSAVVSPDGRLLADVYSFANRPPELFVMANRPGAEMAQLTVSPTESWLGFRWLAPEIVAIPASDGARVPARIYRPQELGAAPNGAAVIFVHGAGYLQNVHNMWSTYFREYMFHHFLASRGYVVLDIDYRGSAGHGRDWRTAIYRHMGGRDLQDQVDGARYLQRELGIEPERIGIYGGSYGGFITLMALFTEPQWFGAGAALRAVTDWAHYNHGYTARILNLPQEDTLAYRRSSPIYFAEGLRDPLLIAHGMVDVNVHFQDVVRLTQRLIELGKTDWEMAIYPVEDHAFVRPSSWADEYRRIFELFERHLPARVPARPDPPLPDAAEGAAP